MHLGPRLDQLVRRDALVDRAQHLVAARLEAEVHAREPGLAQQRELGGRATRQRPRAPVRRHALHAREARLHAPDHRGQLLGLHGARVGVLQKHGLRSATQKELHLVRLARQLAGARRLPALVAQDLGAGRHRVHVGEHVLDVPLRGRRPLVHGAERAAVPGAVADHAHEQAHRLARRADRALLEAAGRVVRRERRQTSHVLDHASLSSSEVICPHLPAVRTATAILPSAQSPPAIVHRRGCCGLAVRQAH